MFVATDSNPYTEMPPNCTFSEKDWHILASFWHPVAFSKDVQDKPVAAKLLDVNLVLYRTVDGIAAAKDLCIHRGAALSLGWLDDEKKNIVCPFHGLHYDVNGRCTRIPSLPEAEQKIPSRLRTVAYQMQERYGLVWVCMKEEAKCPIPEWPLLETTDPSWLTVDIPQAHWDTSAPRHVENFNDVAHFSWVHLGTFGNKNHPYVPNYELKKLNHGLFISLPYPEVTSMKLNQNDTENVRNVTYTKELTYPFATDLTVLFDNDAGFTEITHIYDIASPKSAKETAIFELIQTNVPGAKASEIRDYVSLVNSEDVPIVQSQKPEQVPLNMAAEIHIPADKMSIQYRKDLIEKFGLGAPELTA